MAAALSVNFPTEKELFAENVVCPLTVEGTTLPSVLRVVLGDNESLNFQASPLLLQRLDKEGEDRRQVLYLTENDQAKLKPRKRTQAH